MVLGGCACLLVLILPDTWSNTISFVGKFFISGAYSFSYLISLELFPTSIRNFGLGVSSVMARIGGILCPFVLITKGLSGIRTIWICPEIPISGLIIPYDSYEYPELPQHIFRYMETNAPRDIWGFNTSSRVPGFTFTRNRIGSSRNRKRCEKSEDRRP